MNNLDKFVSRYGRLPTEVDPDYLEMLRMSKYRLLDVPDVSPGKCGNCGASKNDGRKYVDIGLHIDWYGAMYLCGHCIKDIANEAGLFRELEQALEDLVDREASILEMHQKGEALHEIVKRTHQEFEDFYANLRSFELDSDSDSSASSGANLFETKSDRAGTAHPEPAVIKSTPVTRRENIPSLTELMAEHRR